MIQEYKFGRCWQYTWVGAIACTLYQTFAFTTPVLAQSNIVPDNTLGIESSVVTPNALGLPREEITGGAIRGANLFHSFQEFNVDAGRSVYFLSPDASIQNILTRVTGTNASQIFGTLGTVGNANLFLINPNGIIFGPNAALNVGGSFVGTTASAFQFGNFGNFSADAPNAPSPLLTINPSALLFNQLSPASITNQSTASAGLDPIGNEVTGLRVPDGRSLLLVGGNVNLDGGNLRAYEGRIELAGLATPGSFGLDVAGNTFKLSVPEGVPRADVSLTNGAEVNVRGANGGSIAINAQNLSLAGESKVRAGIDTGLGTPQSKAGNIDINATLATTLTDDSFIGNVPQPTSIGNGGDINMTTGSLSLINGSYLNTNNFGQGDGGNINLNVSGALALTGLGKTGASAILSSVESQAVGKGGSINITAGSVSLADSAQLIANMKGLGDAGRIFVQASGAISLANSDIYNNLGRSAVGNSGGIFITAESLSLTDGAQLQSSILGANASEPGGRGNAGGVNINVGTSITLAGVNQNGSSSGIFTDVEAGAVGNGGDININAKSLSLTDDAILNASTNGQGDAARVFVQASGAVSIDNSNIYNNVGASAVGNSGGILITAESLSLTDGAQLQSSILGATASELGGRGNPGGVNINVSDRVTLAGVNQNGFFSGIFTKLEAGAEGNGGDININARSLSLTDGAVLDTRTSGKGNGGNIIINARDRVDLDGKSDSYANTSVQLGAVGKAGDIRVTTGTLSLTNGAFLTSSTLGNGDGGNITIDARDTISFDGSSAQSYVFDGGVGKGGDIRVTTGTLSLINGAQLVTNVSGRGEAGNITIDARDTVNIDGVVGNAISGVQSSLLGGVGKGGDIRLTTGSLAVQNGAALSTDTDGRGNAGNITLNARDTIIFEGVGSENGLLSNAGSEVGSNGIGSGGNIRVNARALFLKNGGQLNANSFGQGNAGSITIDADVVAFEGFGTYGLQSSVQTLGDNGNGGDIFVTTHTLSLTNGGALNTFARGNAGNITINARDHITIDGVVSSNGRSSGAFSSLWEGKGKGGDIFVTTGSLSLTNGAQLASNTLGQGNAGNITINARDAITLNGTGSNGSSSGLFSGVASTGVGKGGDIRVTTGSLTVSNGAGLSASTFGQGNGGKITIDARDRVTFDGVGSNQNSSGAYSTLESTAVGDAGNIKVTTGSLFLNNGAQFSAGTFGSGKAGDITIDARNAITLNGTGSNGRSSGIFSVVGSTGVGKGGDILVTTGYFTVSDGAYLAASTSGQGNGGNITINARDIVRFDGVGSNQTHTGAYSTVESTAVGNAGSINVTTGSLYLNNGALINATTVGSGKAGDITIDARDAITLNGTGSNGSFSGLFSTVGSTGVGKGGDIRVKSGTLSLSNNAFINASTSGRADAGNISVKVDDAVTLTNSSQIRTTVESGGVGKAGDIDIIARSLFVADGSQIQSVLFRPIGILPAAQGRGGNIRVTTTDSITLSGIGSTGFSSALVTSTDRETTGNAGNITVTTRNFRVVDAANVAAGSSGFGDGGNITINASSFAALNGGQVLTNTRGSGKAGTITLNVKDTLTLAGSDPNFTQRLAQVEQRLRQPGQTDQLSDVINNQGPTSGIFANTAPGSTGLGGSIFIAPRQVSIRDGAKISVNSDGTGNAGNITILADILTLDNGAEISAQTTSSQGGNINLQLGELLLLRRGSQISTNAGTAQKGGDGGNININSKFIIAVPQENSDITANAYTGTGGNIQINSDIFGIESRPQSTDLSDITASSTLGVAGAVNINTPNTEAVQNGLTQLPSNIIDANALIANSCIAKRNNQSSGIFLITGNGGLAERPGDTPLFPYPTETIRSISTGELVGTNSKRSSPQKITAPIVEAQGIYRLANGELVLSRECP
ncbi:beta strand repeat-containing protein [Iningainema tapete]|uniref:Filamentous hemagglutinin N-terminal domain-containing protein n=1 Tax=Iningainema tapete BLCC-T55 TaxID=2748662 RepID=A0A8J6XLE6_9CYAN|nr:filamentous hemagglutinin N-terminal domain-containing protein [Iningainema tapete]MBD2776918.1 filamentous hemagglutinin N-terminal domain-containing protein [Iningainema tapete BLCC-T55]